AKCVARGKNRRAREQDPQAGLRLSPQFAAACRLDICPRRRLLQPATGGRWAQGPERLAHEVGQAAARTLEIQRKTLLASNRSLPRLCLGGLRVQTPYALRTPARLDRVSDEVIASLAVSTASDGAPRVPG